MNQSTSADLEYESRTRREIFLERLGNSVWPTSQFREPTGSCADLPQTLDRAASYIAPKERLPARSTPFMTWAAGPRIP